MLRLNAKKWLIVSAVAFASLAIEATQAQAFWWRHWGGGSSGGSSGGYYGGSYGGSSGGYYGGSSGGYGGSSGGYQRAGLFARRHYSYGSSGGYGYGSSGGSSGGSSAGYGSSGGSSGGYYGGSSGGYSAGYGSSGGSSGGISYGSSGGMSYGSAGYGVPSGAYSPAMGVPAGVPAGTPMIQPGVVPMNPPPAPGPGPANNTSINISGDSVTMNVNVPTEAKVFVNGLATSSVGNQRRFVSNGLENGFNYTYELRAEVERNGKLVSETKVVKLRAGEVTDVDFKLEGGAENKIASEPVNTKLTLNVPANAKVFLAGNATASTGAVREFNTTRLLPGQTWNDYTIRVEFEQNGQTLVQERKLALSAGDARELTIDLDSPKLASAK